MLRSLFALLMIGTFARYAVGSVYIAMLMYWWFGIFRPQEWMWWDVSMFRLPLLAAALFVGTALLKGYYPRSTHPIWILMVLFLVAALLSTINGCHSYEAVTITYIVILTLVVLVTERVLQSTQALWGLLLVASASLAYFNAELGFDALLKGYTLYSLPIARGSFSDGNSSALGAGMGVFMLMFVIGSIGSGTSGNTPGWLMHRWPRWLTRVFLYVLLLGSIVFIFKTESRGSALSLLLGLAIWTLLHPKRFRVAMLLSVIAGAVMMIGVPPSYEERIASAFAESHELEESAASRPHFWATAERMAQSNTFGVGIGCYKARYDSYDRSGGRYGSTRSVHSSHYSVLAETGYPGALVWLLLLTATYATLLRVRSRAARLRLVDTGQHFHFRLSNALIASLTVFVAGGSFYEMAYNDYTWLIFAMTIAMSRLQLRGLR